MVGTRLAQSRLTMARASRFFSPTLLSSLLMAIGCGGTFTEGPGGNGGGANGGNAGSAGGGAGGQGQCEGDVACPGIACASGFVAVTPRGQCCPTCVPGGSG